MMDIDTIPDKEEVKGSIKVSFNVLNFERLPFDVNASRAAVEVKEVCSRLSFAIFKGEDKISSKHQESDQEGFGAYTASLTAGTYRLVVIGHSGSGSATITLPTEIKFPNNKLTDTFYYCTDFTLSENTQFDITLKRAVAMFRLVIKDVIPQGVEQIKFYYTGGSSTLNAVTGRGCVNSRQTEYRTITDEMVKKSSQFDIYTFPHEENDVLKIEITALGNGETELYKKEFTEVPVTLNTITQYSGNFFNGNGGDSQLSNGSFSFKAESEWQQKDYTY